MPSPFNNGACWCPFAAYTEGGGSDFGSDTLYPKPQTLNPTRYNLSAAACAINPQLNSERTNQTACAGGGRMRRWQQNPSPYNPRLTPYISDPASYTLHPTPHNLHPTPFIPHPTPHTLHPTPLPLSPQTSGLSFRNMWAEGGMSVSATCERGGGQATLAAGWQACSGVPSVRRHINSQPSTLHPQPSTLKPSPSTLNPQYSTLHPQPSTLNPQPSTLHPQPCTLNPQPLPLNPPPSTLTHERCARSR